MQEERSGFKGTAFRHFFESKAGMMVRHAEATPIPLGTQTFSAEMPKKPPAPG